MASVIDELFDFLTGNETETRQIHPGTVRLVDVCRKHFYGHAAHDCNAFVKAVASELRIPVPDKNANGILQTIRQGGIWVPVGSPIEALRWAREGYFVLAGLRSDEMPGESNGHVAIVSPAPMHKGHMGQPRLWCGSKGHAWGRVG